MKSSEVLKMLEELCPEELADLKSELGKKSAPDSSSARLPCAYQMHATVYRRLSTEPQKGMIISVCFGSGGSVIYTVAWGHGDDTKHHEMELTTAPSWGGQPEEPNIIS